MSRAARLLQLIQLLRRHRRPVAGAALAAELGVSLRSLYRDIATLQAQGTPIEGAAGLGYLLRSGYTLPPLMFTPDEVQALALGTRWVAQRADGRLATAARDALAKITAVVPAALQHEIDSSGLLVGPGAQPAVAGPVGDALRQAMRQEHKLHLHYRDLQGRDTQRTVWPLALGYFDRAQVLVAWCELRQASRHFRCDCIVAVQPTGQRYPRRRSELLRAWRDEQARAGRGAL